jgi:hypothetical protein
MDYRDIDL